MTDAIEAEIIRLMGKVEELGGAVAAIEQGFQKSEIERTAYLISQEIDAGDRPVVGVNCFTLDEEEPYEPLRVDPSIGAQQSERLARMRAERDNDAVQRHLDEIRAAAAGDTNLLVPMKAALRERATVGEVCDALRAVWGQYTPPDTF